MAQPAAARSSRVKRTSTADDKKKEAQRLVNELIGSGMSTEGIADALHVNNHTVLRWKAAQTAPHPGHRTKLQQLADERRAPKKG